MESKDIRKELSDFDDDDIIQYVEDELDKYVYDEERYSCLSDFDDDDIINYIEDNLHKYIYDEEMILETRRGLIDTAPELREHLLDILGMGHWQGNTDIIERIQSILGDYEHH